MVTTHLRPQPLPAAHETLAGVAHDLRLPLSHIKGFVSSLRRDDIAWDEATRQEFLAEIELEADRLAQMLEALLQASRPAAASGPRTTVAPTEPGALVKGALHRTRGLLEGRPLRVEIAPDLPPVRADAAQLERVLANLLQNAVKYTPAGTPIGIAARLNGSGDLELLVEDEGPGIPPADRERIFAPFYRHPATRQSAVPGHGLGLAICHSIVLAHGGRLAVTDRPGGGARFSVVLPTRPPATPLTSPDQEKEHNYDPAEHFGGRRRGADAQTAGQQPQGQRLHRAGGGRRAGGLAIDRGAPLRPVAA